MVESRQKHSTRIKYVSESNPKKRYCVYATLITALLFSPFLILFVYFPIIFQNVVEIQRTIVFPIVFTNEANFDKTQSFVQNFYVNVDNGITLGCWEVFPAPGNNHTLLYLHGNMEVRADYPDKYSVLRKYFHIFACDYRGYGDSSPGELNEDRVVEDTVNLYKWLSKRYNNEVFVWGHSLGTGVATLTLANLKRQSLKPAGLILEAPFTSIPDVVESQTFFKLFSWLPWYESTMIKPFTSNGLAFKSINYITDVECPIMFLHSADDPLIPHYLSHRLYEEALRNRHHRTKSAVTYHLLGNGYGHTNIYKAPTLGYYISEFLEKCSSDHHFDIFFNDD